MASFWISTLMFLFLVISRNGLCQNFAESIGGKYDFVETNEPHFMTKGQLFRATVGDSIVLPCKVENLGSYILLWRRGASVLTAANLMVIRDARFKMVDGYNLQISDIKISDGGDYVCQIGDQEPRDQIHTLEILVPSSIKPVPNHGQVSARQGSNVHLECAASGNPVPTVHWFRKHSKMPLGDGSILTLEKADRQHSGIYQCEAVNGVRQPAMAEIVLKVLTPPDVVVEKTWVHAAVGAEVEVVCILHSDPNSELMWYHNTFLLQSNDRISTYSHGNKFTLRIRNFHMSDFGNYSCVAENVLGKTKKYIEVSGSPGPTEFMSPQYSNHPNRYNLTFKIESLSTLEEIKLVYRKLMINETYQKPSKWVELILPPSISRYDARHFVISYIIKHLEHSSVYELMVQAKNKFGWNEPSDIYQIHTRNKGFKNENSNFNLINSISFSSSGYSIRFCGIATTLFWWFGLIVLLKTLTAASINLQVDNSIFHDCV